MAIVSNSCSCKTGKKTIQEHFDGIQCDNKKMPPVRFELTIPALRVRCLTTWPSRQLIDYCKIVTWRTGLKFRPLRGLGVGNIVYAIRLIQKYMVIEVLLCGLGSLVSEGHFLFPKARTPRTPRFIYATQDSDGRRVSEWAAEHDHMIRAL